MTWSALTRSAIGPQTVARLGQARRLPEQLILRIADETLRCQVLPHGSTVPQRTRAVLGLTTHRSHPLSFPAAQTRGSVGGCSVGAVVIHACHCRPQIYPQKLWISTWRRRDDASNALHPENRLLSPQRPASNLATSALGRTSTFIRHRAAERAARSSSPSSIAERHGMRPAAIAKSHDSPLHSREDLQARRTPACRKWQIDSISDRTVIRRMHGNFAAQRILRGGPDPSRNRNARIGPQPDARSNEPRAALPGAADDHQVLSGSIRYRAGVIDLQQHWSHP